MPRGPVLLYQTVSRWPGTPAAQEAQGRLNVLGDPRLEEAVTVEETVIIEEGPTTREGG